MNQTKGKKGTGKKNKPKVDPEVERELKDKEVQELYFNTVGSRLIS